MEGSLDSGLERTAGEKGKRPFVLFEDATVRCNAFAERVSRLARGLHDAGIGRVERITIRGRERDPILVRGMNVYPREIDEAIGARPGAGDLPVGGAGKVLRRLLAARFLPGAVPTRTAGRR